MILSWSTEPLDPGMPEDILVNLRDIVHRHPWWIARATLAISFLRRLGISEGGSVLDAGCGWGVTMEALERDAYQVVGLDLSRGALQQLDREGRVLIHADLAHPPPAGAPTFDAVLALDVIEHVNDDRAVLQNLARLTRRGGAVIVSVPALPALYSEFDAIQGHRRRYLPHTLTHAFAATGLSLRTVVWWGSWLVPLLWISRRRPRRSTPQSPAAIYRQYLTLPSGPARALMRFAFRLEHVLALRGALRIGTSLFALATRTG